MSTIRVDNFGPSAGGTTYSARGIAKAWVNFNGTGTIAARDSENVSSLTDQGTGEYLVNFVSNMQGDDYAVSASAAGAGSVYECWLGSAYGYPAASSVGLGTGYDTPVVQDTPYVTCTITGDLA